MDSKEIQTEVVLRELLKAKNGVLTREEELAPADSNQEFGTDRNKNASGKLLESEEELDVLDAIIRWLI
ncbi:MAG: hypothetical protein V1689_11280 [Pseudomonadota bacterium]